MITKAFSKGMSFEKKYYLALKAKNTVLKKQTQIGFY